MSDKTCAWCEHPIPQDNFDGVYCNRQCFDAAIDDAIANEPILLTQVKREGCKFRKRIRELRDDAEKRVTNIDSYNTNKLMLTRAYFQSRADVLNDLLVMLDPTQNSCSCC